MLCPFTQLDISQCDCECECGFDYSDEFAREYGFESYAAFLEDRAYVDQLCAAFVALPLPDDYDAFEIPLDAVALQLTLTLTEAL